MLEIPEHNANIISFLALGYWNVMIYARIQEEAQLWPPPPLFDYSGFINTMK